MSENTKTREQFYMLKLFCTIACGTFVGVFGAYLLANAHVRWQLTSTAREVGKVVKDALSDSDDAAERARYNTDLEAASQEKSFIRFE